MSQLHFFNFEQSTVELGNKELFGRTKIFSLMPKVPYPYEVNGKLVTGNGSLIPISSLIKRSILEHEWFLKYISKGGTGGNIYDLESRMKNNGVKTDQKK